MNWSKATKTLPPKHQSHCNSTAPLLLAFIKAYSLPKQQPAFFITSYDCLSLLRPPLHPHRQRGDLMNNSYWYLAGPINLGWALAILHPTPIYLRTTQGSCLKLRRPPLERVTIIIDLRQRPQVELLWEPHPELLHPLEAVMEDTGMYIKFLQYQHDVN